MANGDYRAAGGRSATLILAPELREMVSLKTLASMRSSAPSGYQLLILFMI